MAGILEFNTKRFDDLLKQYGLENAWINILSTKISKNPKHKYILSLGLIAPLSE
jgi:hypothetical protein